jgi:hypothetical protein
MFKKVILLLCVLSLMVWAAKPKAKTASAPKAKTTTKAVETKAADDEFDDSDFVSADKPESAATAAAVDADDEDEEESEDVETAGMSRAQKDDMEARKKFEEEQRLDEYANSERRRDWLKDRLILQLGMGSRYPFMGETGMGMGFGVGAEYITRWHVGAYASFGFLPKGTDNEFDDWSLEGGTGYKVGINYYLFPKNPLHLGISASYGTVYFDHDIIPDDKDMRALISVNGFQFDALIAYMTNEWYYLQFSIGMYYAPDLGKSPESNPSFRESEDSRTSAEITHTSRVVNKDGMDKTGIVFGIAIGYALPEFFPDDTEKRRRQREKERERNSRR